MLPAFRLRGLCGGFNALLFSRKLYVVAGLIVKMSVAVFWKKEFFFCTFDLNKLRTFVERR
jgi:hypothetical protein